MTMFLIIGLLALLMLALALLIAMTDPQTTVEDEVEVDVNGTMHKKKIQKKTWSLGGTAIEVLGIPALVIMGILLFLLVVPSDMMVQTRLALWNRIGVNNPDNAHSVYDPPEAMVVTDGQVTFQIPQGIHPLWIVVTLDKDDSNSVPLDCVTTSYDAATKQEISTVTYRNKAISPKKPLKAMYGIATGPSGETAWKVEGKTDASTVTAG